MSTMQTSTDSATCTDSACSEFGALSRRGFLRGSLGVAAAATTATYGTAFVQTAYAATRSAPAVLVVLSLRGACDGLSLVVPHADPVYYQARPNIAVPSEKLLAKDGMFGLHPMLAPLLPMWNAGRMAAVHATGLPIPNRSHFAAMEQLEDADPGSSARVGWLNRLIGRDSYSNPLQAIQIGSAVTPTSLYGPHQTAATRTIDSSTLAGQDHDTLGAARANSLQTVWAGVGGVLGSGARASLQVVSDFAPVRATSETPANGAAYPNGDLGTALAAAARTIRGDVGAEVITVDHGSWDMHTGLGTLGWGDMIHRTDELAKALAAFFTDLGSLGSKVTVVTLSEFGRRVKENANNGLDHGHGSVMFLLGAGVKGGSYYGQWPGLTNTSDADLLVTRDYRSVLGEVVSKRFGASTAQVFPGVSLEQIGVMA
jgi:uncharacterized protein (DUF1501 family)